MALSETPSETCSFLLLSFRVSLSREVVCKVLIETMDSFIPPSGSKGAEPVALQVQKISAGTENFKTQEKQSYREQLSCGGSRN